MTVGAAELRNIMVRSASGNTTIALLQQISLPQSSSHNLSETGGRISRLGIHGGRSWFSKNGDVFVLPAWDAQKIVSNILAELSPRPPYRVRVGDFPSNSSTPRP